ncbi:MAG: FAD-dependent monooxygenase [Methylobacteriaceae bacterium]|nr:FAD-dependent monooxygenase [Methylobacteriaceae bacterium]
MSNSSFHVGIIGAGTGGLCLAHGLRKAGVGVTVYERDRHPTDRLQGYRLHISPNGSRALHECLPPDVFRHFVATCGAGNDDFKFLTEKMEQLLAIETEGGSDAVDSHRSASRLVLRQVLLEGLDGMVEFGKTFTRYEETDTGEIVAHFEDGTSASADILVAADGGGSRVRRQFLPDAPRVDTGVFGIAGKFPLTEATAPQVPAELLAGPRLVMARDQSGMFVAPQRFGHGPERSADAGHGSARSGDPFAEESEDYMMWGYSGLWETADVLSKPAPSREELQDFVRERTASWHPGLQKLVELADPATVTLFDIKTSVPIDPWPTKRITLIGDAIHSMTPFRGIGANMALRDASLLAKNLAAAAHGERTPIEAIHAYEAAMIGYGFAAVRSSLKAMELAITKRGISFALTKAAYRVFDAVPPLKRWAFGGLGNA